MWDVSSAWTLKVVLGLSLKILQFVRYNFFALLEKTFILPIFSNFLALLSVFGALQKISFNNLHGSKDVNILSNKNGFAIFS